MLDVLVLGATKQELEGVLPNLGVPCSMGPYAVLGLCIGVGKVVSAVETCKALETYHPKRVVLLGWAGGIEQTLAIGDGVMVREVVQYDLDLRSFGLPLGSTLSSGGKPLSPAIHLFCPAIPGFREVVCGTADRFMLPSYRMEHPELLEALKLDICDMEGYSVAYACQKYGIECTMLRIISDDAQGRRPKPFSEFVRNASEKLSRALQLLLAKPSEKSPTSL